MIWGADRLAEIHSRYGPDHLVSRLIAASTPCILSAVRVIEAALADVRQAGPGKEVADPQAH